ncbi:hypothetical protein HYH02_010278 [Chlamydomonas schloesseri]|uniref:Post-SET domain-containing protein n=1 Tax=Chlamydomonas schloesseri TaxID=2026947 RepID=A0A835TBY1_9CHLO|nr:hypothetical protein HYH02_010278 [Chlamydomonas schloesseri]|eukprot:KAG2440388.1 hypothetical protein HYH02_010278 [Chlamydomonas schloesseri]
MKRAASQREDRESSVASSGEQAAKERKRQAAHIARLVKSTEELNASLRKAAAKRESSTAQVLGRLSEVGQRYMATLLAGKLTRQGVRCGGCSSLITGGAAYKLNHSCAPNMESSPVWVPAWGDVVVSVLQPPPGAGPLAAHEELCWSYSAVCDTKEEEMGCQCGVPGCSGLLVLWGGHKPPGRAARPALLAGLNARGQGGGGGHGEVAAGEVRAHGRQGGGGQEHGGAVVANGAVGARNQGFQTGGRAAGRVQHHHAPAGQRAGGGQQQGVEGGGGCAGGRRQAQGTVNVPTESHAPWEGSHTGP